MEGVAFKPDNPNILVSCSWDKTIKMWDITSGSCLSTLMVDGQVSSLDVSPCGTKIAALSYHCRNRKYEIKVFSLNPLSGDWEIGSEPPLRGHKDPVRSLCFSPCGTKIVSGGGEETMFGGKEDFSIRVWDAKTGALIGSPLTCDRYDATLLYDCRVCGHFTAKCFNTVTLDHADYNISQQPDKSCSI